MSKKPNNILDTVLQQDEDNINDEKYNNNQERRKFSISRSGRFKSRNKRRESLDSNLFTNSQELNLTSSSSINIDDNQNQKSDKIHNKDTNLTKYNNYTESDKKDKFTEQPKSEKNQTEETNDELKEFFETSL